MMHWGEKDESNWFLSLNENEEFSFRIRNKIDELVQEFIDNTEGDVHAMLCENDAENHHGLDSDRDTEEEIETTVRFDSFQTFYLTT